MARLIDDRGRLFGKVNVVDILVLLVVIAVATFVGLRVSDGGAGESVPVKTTYAVQPANHLMVAGYTTLGALYDQAGRYLGTISSAEVVEPEPIHFAGWGDKFGLYFAEASQVLIVVESEGILAGDSVHVGSLDARVGTKLSLRGPGWQGDAYIVDVDWGAAATE